MLKKIWLGAIALVVLWSLVLNADPLKLKVAASIEERYSDNVFFDAENQTSDLITRFSPAVEGGWRTERTDLLLSWRPDFYYYRDTSDLNAVDQYCDGRLSHQWTERLSTTLSVSYLDDERAERELSDTGLLFNNDPRQRRTYGFGGQYQISEKAALALSCGYTDETFDNPQDYDYGAHTVSVLFSRNLEPLLKRSTGRIQAGYALYDYSRDYSSGNVLQVIDVHDQRTYQNYSLSLGLARSMTERLELTVDLGARLTHREDEIRLHTTDFLGRRSYQSSVEEDDSLGFVGMLEAVYTSEKSRFSALLSHDLVPASGRNGATERTTLRLADNGRLTGDLYFDVWMRAYRNRTEETGTASQVDEHTVQFNAGLRYAFNPTWSLGAYWLTTWVEDRGTDVDKTQNTFALRLMWNRPVLE